MMTWQPLTPMSDMKDPLQPMEPERVAAVLDHPLVAAARESAHRDFQGKLRKVPRDSAMQAPPYVRHLEDVAQTLAEAGCRPEVVAAGYLHDHVEDLPGIWSRERIASEFGEEVATLVDWVTQQDKSHSWEARNAAYNQRLHAAPAEALAISAADKLSNLTDVVALMRLGYPLTSFLKRGFAENSAKMHELAGIYAGRIPIELENRFVALLDEFDRLGKRGPL